MTRIYLTRHGQTVWNLDKRLQGSGNSELTKRGIRQAESLRDRLSEVDIDVIYTSPIKRAYETAEILSGMKRINIIKDDGLKEINFGEYEGHTEEELLKEGRGVELDRIFNGEMDVRAPGGESLHELFGRVKKSLDDMLLNEEGKNILIVSHGMTLKAVVNYFKNNEDFYNVIMGQASLSKVIKKGSEFSFEYINDTSHLGDEEKKKGW